MAPLNESPFSRHFNVLMVLGAWYFETRSRVRVNLFIMYRLIMSIIGVYGALSMIADFYLVMGDLKKMSWNLCVSILFVGILTKTIQLLPKNDVINKLRLSLHQDAESKTTAEDILIQKTAVWELKVLQISFYGCATIFIPVWLLTRYFNYKGELPVPVRLPFYIDLNDNVQFSVMFFLIALAGVIGLTLVIETELAMFGLMIQISREYVVLMKEIPKLNELYEMKCGTENEVNPFLKKTRTKLLVKEFSARQKQLIEYTKEFEGCYNQSFLHEFFGISVLIVTLGLQCMLETVDISGNMIYQIGYLTITTVDLFLICWFSTRLQSQCFEVGEVAYSTLWYKMETDCQKDIAMIIMRSQHPPKITTGKLMVLDLNAFISRISSIISWLTLFRELLARQGSPKN